MVSLETVEIVEELPGLRDSDKNPSCHVEVGSNLG